MTIGRLIVHGGMVFLLVSMVGKADICMLSISLLQLCLSTSERGWVLKKLNMGTFNAKLRDKFAHSDPNNAGDLMDILTDVCNASMTRRRRNLTRKPGQFVS
nr:unnamed protein product [Callosobruchus chinensis]